MSIQLPQSMSSAKNNKEQQNRLREYASLIEKYFEAYYLITRVAEVNTETYGIQFCVEIALGTPVEKFIKHSKGLATILATPNHQITVEAPIPGRYMIGITIPWVHKYPDIPDSDYPDVNSKHFELLKKSVNYYRQYNKVAGLSSSQSPNDNEQLINDYFFLKGMFDTWEKKPDLRKYALLIEKTLEALGVFAQVTEIDIEPDHYNFYVKQKDDAESKNISQYSKDIALAMASPTGRVDIQLVTSKRNTYCIIFPRVNFLNVQQQFGNKQILPLPNGFLRKKICKYLFDKCRVSFRKYELISKDDRYILSGKFFKQFRKLKTSELVDLFNNNVSKTQSGRERAAWIGGMQREFDRRNIDYSDVASLSGGLVTNRKITLANKKIVTQ